MRLSKYAFTFLIIFLALKLQHPEKKQLKTVEKVKLVARNIEIMSTKHKYKYTQNYFTSIT